MLEFALAIATVAVIALMIVFYLIPHCGGSIF